MSTGGEAGPTSDWTAGRVVALVAGSISFLLGLILVVGGLGLVLVHTFARDAAGYYTSDVQRFASGTRAITVEDIDLGGEPGDWLPGELLGRARVRAERSGTGAVFVGIGRKRDVDAYLRGVSHSEIEEWRGWDFIGRENPPSYRLRPGRRVPPPPSTVRLWVAAAEGLGRQTVDWEPRGGRWAAVVMNADAAPRVVVDVDLGARVGWLLPAGVGLLIGGVLVSGLGVLLGVLAARRATGARRGAGGNTHVA